MFKFGLFIFVFIHLPFLSHTVYPKKYAHDYCFAVLCCGYTLTDFPISIRLTSLALWQSNDCPSASKATLMNMDKYFMRIHYERLHNHNKAKHNKTVCIFLGIYCTSLRERRRLVSNHPVFYSILLITHHNAVHSRYIAVILLWRFRERHPIARPWGRGMWCRSRMQNLAVPL